MLEQAKWITRVEFLCSARIGGRLWRCRRQAWQNRRERKSADEAGGWCWRSRPPGASCGLGGRGGQRDGIAPRWPRRTPPWWPGFGLAARNLEQLLTWKPDSDEAAYVLGLCEQCAGELVRPRQRGPGDAPGSDFTQRAILARLQLLHGAGRLSDAEKLVIDAANDPRNDRTDLLVLLVPIYSEIGRSDEAERLIQDRWEHLNARGEATPEQSIKLVRVHIELTFKAPSLENLRRLPCARLTTGALKMIVCGSAEPTWR